MDPALLDELEDDRSSDDDGIDVFARLNELAWSTAGVQPFLNQAADAVARYCHAPLVMIALESDARHVEATVALDETWSERWHAVVEAEMIKAQAGGHAIGCAYGSKTGGPSCFVGAAPVVSAGGAPIGAIGLVTGCDSRAHAEIVTADLRATAAHLGNLLDVQRSAITSSAEGADASRILARAATCRSVHEFAFIVANSLRARFECEQVAMGQVVNDRVEVLCVSSVDEAKRRTPGVIEIRQAMEECLDAGRAVVQQPNEDEIADGDRYRLHRVWRQSTGGGAVASFPLIVGGKCVAIASLRHLVNARWNPHDIAMIEKVLGQVGAALPLLARASETFVGRARRRTRETRDWLLSPTGMGRKVVLAGVLAIAGWFLFGRVAYTVNAATVVAAAEIRHVVAPFEGRIESCAVDDGSRVRAGDVLLRMATDELELERARHVGELDVLASDLTIATEARDLAAAAMADARHRQVEAELRLVEHRIRNAVIRAPFDGLVLESDLEKQLGAVVPLGDPLMQLTSANALTFELLVPEHAITDVEVGQTVHFASVAEPERVIACTVARIAPSAAVRDGHNVFVVEADVDPMDALRVGMKGVSRIDAGRRPVWWMATHRMIDAFRLRFGGDS